VAVAPLCLAVIVAVPLDRPVAAPVVGLIDRTAGASLDQSVTLAVEPPGSEAVAVKVTASCIRIMSVEPLMDTVVFPAGADGLLLHPHTANNKQSVAIRFMAGDLVS
jgi:hypothetical protein